MMYLYRNVSKVLVGTLMLSGTHVHAAVDSIAGDSGGGQAGAVSLTGSSSGAVFSGSSSTITQSFNYLSLPATTSTNGQILIDSSSVLHSYPEDSQNIFVGASAGNFSTTSANNAGFGAAALNAVTSGGNNAAHGKGSLASITTGSDNTAVGNETALGMPAGNNNVFFGSAAGSAYTNDESNNIVIGAGNSGVEGESNIIRLGIEGSHEACYVAGIFDATIDSETALTAYVDVNGQLGTVVSTAERKEHIHTIGNDSKPIFDLRPVSFNLKSDPKKIKLFGLIAEEVFKVFPELVVKDKKGKPLAVRYDELPVLLLNELQKKSAKIEKLEDAVSDLTARVAKLENMYK